MSDIDDIYSAEELNEIEAIVNEKHLQTWFNICNAIKHEMYPKLASAIRPIISDQNDDGKSDNHADQNREQLKIALHDIKGNVNKVIEYLKTKRKLGAEERAYLKRLCQRAITVDTNR